MSKFVAMILIIILFPIVTSGGNQECTREEAFQAENEAAYLTSWEEIYRSYKRFCHCDDGAIAEGYAHSIAKILSASSPKLDQLNSFTRTDVYFEHFIINHISESVPKDETKKIKCNLSRNCPKEANDLCEKLMAAVNEAE